MWTSHHAFLFPSSSSPLESTLCPCNHPYQNKTKFKDKPKKIKKQKQNKRNRREAETKRAREREEREKNLTEEVIGWPTNIHNSDFSPFFVAFKCSFQVTNLWPGWRPLLSVTPPIMGSNWGASSICCCCPVSLSFYRFWSVGSFRHILEQFTDNVTVWMGQLILLVLGLSSS